MKLALLHLQIIISACCYANGILRDLEQAYNFNYSLDCPKVVAVNEIFACNLTINGGERIVSTVQWEDSPPINFLFTGESYST